MRRDWRRARGAVAVVLLLWAAPALAQSGETGGIGGTGISSTSGGIGGTGVSANGGGIGGTGSVAENGGTGPIPDTGGIGGTGATPAGQAIIGYGPIQAFGSVFVNGREYAIDSHTRVTIDGAPATVRALHVGDLAQVQGVTASGPHGYATAISVLHPLIGPITAMGGNGRMVTVLGQRVAAAHDKALFAALRLGTIIAISAQRRADGTWIARAAQAMPPGTPAQMVGPAAFTGGQLSVGGVAVSGPAALAATVQPGTMLTVRGTFAGAALQASSLATVKLLAGAPGTRVEVEDYFRSGPDGRAAAPDGLAAVNLPQATPLTGMRAEELVGTLVEPGVLDVDSIASSPLDSIEPPDLDHDLANDIEPPGDVDDAPALEAAHPELPDDVMDRALPANH